MVKLLFTTDKHILSRLIRVVTWSQWAHVSVICSDNTIIEAIQGHGVRRVTLTSALSRASKYAIVEFKDADEQALEKALLSQLGKGYDYLGAIGIGFFRNWQRDNKWSCGELIAYGFEQIGKPIFRKDEMFKISPQNLWEVQPDGKTVVVNVDN